MFRLKAEGSKLSRKARVEPFKIFSEFCLITHGLPLIAFSLQPIYLVVTKGGANPMAKALSRVAGQSQISSKIHRHLKKLGCSNITLKEMQQSLSGIGVSLSKRVIEEREKRYRMPDMAGRLERPRIHEPRHLQS